jgi:hypothetical protein
MEVGNRVEEARVRSQGSGVRNQRSELGSREWPRSDDEILNLGISFLTPDP